MAFAIGDKIILAFDLDTPILKGGTITKLGKEFCWINNEHKAEDCIYLSYCWPASVKEELLGILTQRQMLKKQFDDSMSLIYQLRNAVSRGER